MATDVRVTFPNVATALTTAAVTITNDHKTRMDGFRKTLEKLAKSERHLIAKDTIKDTAESARFDNEH